MGEKITMTENGLRVPTNPVIPFIEGDGIGPDIWKAAQRVFDAAVEKAYGGERKVEWLEVLAGEKAFNLTGEWLPKETEKTNGKDNRRVFGRYQRTVDNAGRRRHPFAECGAAAVIGFVCMSSSGALLRRY